MSPYDSVDPQSFRRGLTRNLALPLGVGLAGAALFVLLTFYLLHVIGLVEHTDQVLRKATLLQKAQRRAAERPARLSHHWRPEVSRAV